MSNWPLRQGAEPYYDVVEHGFCASNLIRSTGAASLAKRARGWWDALRAPARRMGRPAPEQVHPDRLFDSFIALAPPPLISAIIESATGSPCKGPFRLMGESVWRRLGRADARRPEVTVVAPDAVFILEAKAEGVRASREQVASDALLIQQIRAVLSPKRCGVVHFTVAGFGEVVAPDDEVREAAIRHLRGMRQNGIGNLDANGRVILADTISAFELSVLSFTQLDQVLGGYAAASAPSDAEGRMIDGLRRELRLRGLADAPYLASDMARLAS